MRMELLAHIPLSVGVYAARTAWDSHKKGGKYIVPTNNLIDKDFEFINTLFNNLKHWSVAEHIWYTFKIRFKSEYEKLKTMFYVKNEYNFFSESGKNEIVFSVNMRTLYEEKHSNYKNSNIVENFYKELEKFLPVNHQNLLNGRNARKENEKNGKDVFHCKKEYETNGYPIKIKPLYYYNVNDFKCDFSRRKHEFATFEIKGISRAFLQEIVRHDDLFAGTVKSTRFTLKELQEINDGDEKFAKFLSIHKESKPEEREKIFRIQKESLKTIKDLLNGGAKRDIVKYALPEGYKTTAVITYNIDNLENLIRLRTEGKVFDEFKQTAFVMQKILDDLRKRQKGGKK
jgi:thymidylate synthase (FAD)